VTGAAALLHLGEVVGDKLSHECRLVRLADAIRQSTGTLDVLLSEQRHLRSAPSTDGREKSHSSRILLRMRVGAKKGGQARMAKLRRRRNLRRFQKWDDPKRNGDRRSLFALHRAHEVALGAPSNRGPPAAFKIHEEREVTNLIRERRRTA
jgi:hypothetical protein